MFPPFMGWRFPLRGPLDNSLRVLQGWVSRRLKHSTSTAVSQQVTIDQRWKSLLMPNRKGRLGGFCEQEWNHACFAFPNCIYYFPEFRFVWPLWTVCSSKLWVNEQQQTWPSQTCATQHAYTPPYTIYIILTHAIDLCFLPILSVSDQSQLSSSFLIWNETSSRISRHLKHTWSILSDSNTTKFDLEMIACATKLYSNSITRNVICDNLAAKPCTIVGVQCSNRVYSQCERWCAEMKSLRNRSIFTRTLGDCISARFCYSLSLSTSYMSFAQLKVKSKMGARLRKVHCDSSFCIFLFYRFKEFQRFLYKSRVSCDQRQVHFLRMEIYERKWPSPRRVPPAKQLGPLSRCSFRLWVAFASVNILFNKPSQGLETFTVRVWACPST